jgi:hypothetical protein
LESVPVEGRIFLERTEDNVEVKPAYRDIIQKASYGQSLEKLSILCEDDIGEHFILGVLDVLNPKLGIVHNDIIVGRDTGKEQFGQHIEAMGKFRQLDSFLFVLDGDAAILENHLKAVAQRFGANVQPLFLPGAVPEEWAWAILKQYPEAYAAEMGLQLADLRRQLHDADQVFNNAADRPSNIVKNKYYSFCEKIKVPHLELMRKIAKKETERQTGDIKIFVDNIRLVARGIIEGSKRSFSSHTAPFCGHIAGLYSHKKPSRGKKMTLFSHLADPSQQVYRSPNPKLASPQMTL